MADSTSKAGATGLQILQVAFIVLKLCKVIKWSWWCVMLPTIIPVSLIILAILIIGILKFILKFIEKIKKRDK